MSIDELASLISKGGITGSILIESINSLCEKTTFFGQTKHEKVEITDAHLSIIACCTEETFKEVFIERFTRLGFDNRLFLVWGENRINKFNPKPISRTEKMKLWTDLRNIICALPPGEEKILVRMDPDAEECFQAWYVDLRKRENVFNKRIDTYSKRFLMLMAVSEELSKKRPHILDDEDENGKVRKIVLVDKNFAERVISLMEWELVVREKCKPSQTKNRMAELEEKIKIKLREKGFSMTQRELKRAINADQYGIYFWDSAIKNLEKAGLIKKAPGSKANSIRIMLIGE